MIELDKYSEDWIYKYNSEKCNKTELNCTSCPKSCFKSWIYTNETDKFCRCKPDEKFGYKLIIATQA